jgi:hypothetical protein
MPNANLQSVRIGTSTELDTLSRSVAAGAIVMPLAVFGGNDNNYKGWSQSWKKNCGRGSCFSLEHAGRNMFQI